MRCRIYTDGSFEGGTKVGGWSMVIAQHDGLEIKRGIIEDATNNQSELVAVLNALDYAVRKCIRDIEIITDSMYVLNGATKYLSVWSENGWINNRGYPIQYRQQWEGVKAMLDSINANNFNVTFSKAKSHSGSSLNELADMEAKKAIAEYVRNVRRK